MEAYLDMARDLHTRTMVSFPNSARMFESAFLLSEALRHNYHVAENRKFLENFVGMAVTVLGHAHIHTARLRLNYAWAIHSYHFFGYDGYWNDCAKVIGMLKELTDDIIHRYGKDSDEVQILIPEIEWLLEYTVDNRLE